MGDLCTVRPHLSMFHCVRWSYQWCSGRAVRGGAETLVVDGHDPAW